MMTSGVTAFLTPRYILGVGCCKRGFSALGQYILARNKSSGSAVVRWHVKHIPPGYQISSGIEGHAVGDSQMKCLILKGETLQRLYSSGKVFWKGFLHGSRD